MKNKNPSRGNVKGDTLPIPDLELIDLEADTGMGSGEDHYIDNTGAVIPAEYDDGEIKPPFFSRINIHVVLLAVTVLFVAGLVYKVMTFGVHVDLDEIFQDGPGTYADTFDTFLPLMDTDGNPVFKTYGEGSTILFFGNAPFADDRGSGDNLVSLIRDMTGAEVYNCSVSGSFLAADQSELNADISPWDAFNFYWLCSLATGYHDTTDAEYQKAVAALGESAPPEAMEVYNTLTSIDLSTVDVVVVMYDGSDYLAGHAMYNDGNATDITQFTGNTEAGIELLQYCYPNIRIIIMSPTYAFGLDENGNYVSSDIQRYGWDVLSTYVIKQYASCASRMVTFVDNLYGTINEDNAEDYLTDHLHLNQEGRKKVAERFVYALNYFKDNNSAAQE